MTYNPAIGTERLGELAATVDELKTAYYLGVADGRAQAAAEQAEAWAQLRDRVHAIASMRTRGELDEMDAEAIAGVPCPTRCGRCSACIRASAVRRHGGDYQGGPVRWEGGDPRPTNPANRRARHRGAPAAISGISGTWIEEWEGGE